MEKKYVLFMVSMLIFCLLMIIFLNGFSTAETLRDIKIKEFKDNSRYSTDDVEYWAVIIGTAPFDITYESTINDARGLYTILVEHGWKKENIKILLGWQASKSRIIRALNWLEKKADENDVVLFYFNGHGMRLSSIFNRFYDKAPKDEIDDKDECIVAWGRYLLGRMAYITDDQLGKIFDNIRSKNIVTIFDCCFSGGMIDGTYDLAKPNNVVITSCQIDEKSYPWEFSSGYYGVFSYFLMEALNGVADQNKDNMISAEEAFIYAKEKTQGFDKLPSQQNPEMYDGYLGELILIHLK